MDPSFTLLGWLDGMRWWIHYSIMLTHPVPCPWSHSRGSIQVYFPDPWLGDGLIWAIGMLVAVMPAEAFNVCAPLRNALLCFFHNDEKNTPGSTYWFPKGKETYGAKLSPNHSLEPGSAKPTTGQTNCSSLADKMYIEVVISQHSMNGALAD